MAIREGSSDPSLGSILYLEISKKKNGNSECPRIFASWGGNTDVRVSILRNSKKGKPRAAGARELFFSCFFKENARDFECGSAREHGFSRLPMKTYGELSCEARAAVFFCSD